MGSPEPFARFRRLVLSEPALEERLRSIPDWAAFTKEAVRLAGERGLVLSEGDMQAARAEALRSWRERWV